MYLTTSELCALCLILWGLFHWLGIFAKTRAVMMLLAVLGIGGFLGHALVDAAGWLQRATGAITGWALGTSVPAALFIVLAVLLLHDLHAGWLNPHSGLPRRTSWVAMAAGVLLVAGVTGIPALAPVAAALRSLLSAVAGLVNTL